MPLRSELQRRAIRVLTWDNKNAPAGAGNTTRGLTHSSGTSREGLAMKATRIPQRAIDRLFTKYDVDPERGCWISRYATGSHGYAQIGWAEDGEPVRWLAHRLAYAVRRGPIPEGMTVDHMCKVRKCINPDHLRVLSNYENARRTQGRDWPLGQCRNGHPNSMLHRQRGGKVICKPCLQASRDRWTAKQRAA